MILLIILSFIYTQSLNRFVFTQLKYNQTWNPYPNAYKEISSFLTYTTSIEVIPEIRTLTINDKDLFLSPFLIITGYEFPSFNETEIDIIRKYVNSGGFIFVDNTDGKKGNPFDKSFRNEIKKIFPDSPLIQLDENHAINKAFYLLRGKAWGRNYSSKKLEIIDISGRTVLVYSSNDLLGCWVKDRFGKFIYDCSPFGEQQRWESIKLTINIIVFSLTGTYKTDPVHQPFIKRKLGM